MFRQRWSVALSGKRSAADRQSDIIEGEGLVANAAEVGAYFQSSLREAFADHPLVGEIRGLGLMAGIELVEDRETKKAFDPDLAVAKRLQSLLMTEGLICRPMFNSLGFSPPLIVSRNDVDSIVAMFSAGLEKLTSELGAGGA